MDIGFLLGVAGRCKQSPEVGSMVLGLARKCTVQYVTRAVVMSEKLMEYADFGHHIAAQAYHCQEQSKREKAMEQEMKEIEAKEERPLLLGLWPLSPKRSARIEQERALHRRQADPFLMRYFRDTVGASIPTISKIIN